MQIKAFGEDTGLYHRSQGKKYRLVLRMQLRTLETVLSLFLFSPPLRVFFILLSPYQLLPLLALCDKNGPATVSISSPFKRPG